MSKFLYWTRHEEETLRKKAGKVPLARLASSMGRSKASISSRASALGISLTVKNCSWTDESLQKIAQMRLEGAGWGDIGKQFGISAEGCRTAYNRHKARIHEHILSHRLEEIESVLSESLEGGDVEFVLRVIRQSNLAKDLKV